MNIGFKFAPTEYTEWDLTRTISKILHESEDFVPRTEDERLINFQVKLNPSLAGGIRSDGTGTLTVPTEKIGSKFLQHVYNNPVKIDKKKLKFFKDGSPPKGLALTLEKTPYIDPDLEEEHQKKLRALETRFRVDIVQFGVFYRPTYPSRNDERPCPRAFSIEWERNYSRESSGWLTFEYDHKLIRITVSVDVCFSTA